MKKKFKSVKVIYETHTRELRMATNNKPISNPFLSDSEKSVVPYEEDSDEQEDLFESGELGYLKKIGVLKNFLHKQRLEYEYFLDEETFEIYKVTEEHIDTMPYYLYINENNAYTYAKYDTEYTELYSTKSISEFKTYILSQVFLRRKKIV